MNNDLQKDDETAASVAKGKFGTGGPPENKKAKKHGAYSPPANSGGRTGPPPFRKRTARRPRRANLEKLSVVYGGKCCTGCKVSEQDLSFPALAHWGEMGSTQKGSVI
jgi:hypothetical protein